MTNYIVLRDTAVGPETFTVVGVVRASGPEQAIRALAEGSTSGVWVAVPTRNWTARVPYVPEILPPVRLAPVPPRMPGQTEIETEPAA